MRKTLNYASEEGSRLRAIFENVSEGIITIDENGIVESVNPSAANLFGYAKEEIIGRNVSMLMPEPYRSEHDQYLENYKQTGEAKIIGIGREILGLKKDGTIFPFHLSVSEVILPERRIFTGILFDLTRQRQNEKQLENYASALEKSNQELQNFVYVASHDLQEPLRKIQTFGDRLFQNEKANLSEKGQDYLSRIVNAAERMQDLINGLLSLSRVETEAKEFDSVDLNQVLKGVLNDLEVAIQRSGTTIETGNLPIIEAESFQMRQLFQNLIANALKFRSPERQPVVKVHCTYLQANKPAEQPEKADQVSIRVEDNGMGFDQKFQKQVFEIFKKLNSSKEKGTGIGLAICQKITDRHNGQITVNSKIGEGTTFFVNLPITQQ